MGARGPKVRRLALVLCKDKKKGIFSICSDGRAFVVFRSAIGVRFGSAGFCLFSFSFVAFGYGSFTRCVYSNGDIFQRF